MENYNKKTGLTPQQEKAAVLLASGKTMTETAKELNIKRSTLYQWNEKITFATYFNSLVSRIRDTQQNALLTLVEQSYKTIRESLKSKNESIRLKAALAVIDRVKTIEIGETNPANILRKECTTNLEFEYLNNFDNDKFEKLLKENNLT